MESILIEAIKKYKSGNFQAALELYKKILDSDPNHIQTLLLTGKLYLKVNKPELAFPFFEHANKLAPNSPEIINNIGKTLILLDKPNEARYLLEDLLRDHDEYIPAILNLAKINKLESNLEESILLYQKVLRLRPDSVVALNNLGNIFQQKGKIKEASECFLSAVKINPEKAQLRMNYGNILLLENRLEESLEEYKRALVLNPKLVDVYKYIVELYSKLYPYEKALIEIEHIFKSGVHIPEILLSAAILAINNKDFKLANKLLLKNHELFPNHFESLYQLGITYHQSAYFRKALSIYEKAYKLNDKSDALLYAMAKAYTDLKEDEKSIDLLEEALKINPKNFTVQHELIRNRLNSCDWSKREADKNNLREISLQQVESSTPAPIPFLNLNYFEQENSFLLKCSEHSAINSTRKVKEQINQFHFKHEPKFAEKLRVGYISPDFRNHPTGRVTLDFISAHHKDHFEIFCFSLIADLPKDEIQNEFKESCDQYISLYNVPTVKAAQIIYDHKIDILIDIAGYTTYSRPEILAMQPAPIQCQMIGFPGTMGASFIQYIIADHILVPQEHEKYYSEKIIRLPFGFPGSVLEVNNEKKLRQDFNLPEDKFIYCCFNSQYKYSPEIYDVWMEILREVPESILLLKGGNDVYKNNIRKETKSRNIDASRIYFADNLPLPDYMARNKVCDLFLDTFFYSAGSTAINAMQVGLPMITFLGNTNASRMGASIISAAGLNDFIYNSIEDYKKKAIWFGKNPEELNKIKIELRSTILHKPLFNANQYVSNLEQGFVKIWEKYVENKLPQSIDIN